MNTARRAVCSVLFALLLLPAIAQAQATRTWVSGVGDDANPCSRTAPCRTFAGSISKTAAGGVISVLDPGAYGAVTITKAITIESDGAIAGILASGTNGIIVNAPPSAVVSLRRLSINGAGSGLSGIRFLAGNTLIVEDSTIEAMNRGISFEPSGNASLILRNLQIRGIVGAGEAGVHIQPGASGSASVQAERLQISQVPTGIWLEGPVSGTLRNSAIQGSGEYGVRALGSVDVHLEGTSITDSVTAGIRAEGADAVLRLSGNTVTGNAQGLLSVSGGRILSYGDNRVTGNLANGAPTGTLSMQ